MAAASLRLRSISLMLLTLLCFMAISAMPVTARAQDADEDDLFAEFDDAEARGDAGEEDEEEDEDDATDYGFDNPESMGYGVEELVVTGKASDATAQSIPDAITEFSQSDLDRMDITNVESLSLNTPSLHVGKFGAQPVITLRGVGAANLTTIGTPGVGFEVDGIHQGRPTAAAVRIYDVEDVRVYKGPQGIEGGYLTNGGRISITSKRPQEEFDVMGDVQYGAYDQILLRGAVNVPILPDGLLMSRATVTYENRDGYQDNLIFGVKNLNADDADEMISRFQLRSLLADEAVEIRLNGGYNYQRGIGPARHVLQNNLGSTTEELLLPGPYDNGVLPYERERLLVDDCPDGEAWECRQSDPRYTYADDIGYQDNSQASVNGSINWDMPYFENSQWVSDLRLGAIAGWVSTDRGNRLDVDGTNSPHSYFEQKLSAKQQSVEVFVERPDVDRFDFKLGGYYFREEVDSSICLDALGFQARLADISSDQELLNQSGAAYGTLGYRLFDNLRVGGGVRYSNEKKSADQDNYRYEFAQFANPGNPDPSPTFGNRENDTECSKFYQEFLNRSYQESFISTRPPLGEFSTTGTETWERVTYRAEAEWDITDTSALAFSFSTGFKPGGFSLGANPALGRVTETFGPEDVTQYQLVSKNQIWDSRISANLTLFWLDYDPFQVCQIIGAQYKCDATGRAVSRGVELEVVAMPVDGLSINGHFNYLDATVDNLFLQDPTYIPPGGEATQNTGGPPVDVSGNTLEKAPRFAGSLGVQYDWDFERWGVFSPRVQMQAQSRTYYRVFNKEEFSQTAFAKLDISLEWRSEDGIYLIRGFVNNVTDVDVLNFLFIGPPQIGGPVLGYYMAPRTWGIKVGITSLPDFF